MFDDEDRRYFIHKKGSFLRKAIGGVASFIPGVGPIASAGIGLIPGFGKRGRPAQASMLPAVVGAGARALPGVGRAIQRGWRSLYPGARRAGKVLLGAGGGVAAYEVGGMMIDAVSGQVVGRARKRGRGLSARDIKGAQKVARVVQCFGYKPKMQYRCGKKGRCR